MDEKQPVKKQLSRLPAPFLFLKTVAEILKVFQPPDSYSNSFWGLNIDVFCQCHADLSRVPFTWAPFFFFFFPSSFPIRVDYYYIYHSSI